METHAVTLTGFDAVQDWSQANRELRLARSQAVRVFKKKYPKTFIDERDSWLVTPTKVSRRPSRQGYDWFFHFEDVDGKFVELTVLSSGGIENLDLGAPH